ncbi:hypothetical protein [Streptomyces oceani]|uniref:PH domain-containing protein n=1 Tax=Streptomyces oceani TaxID=1075402 RepID=A0A1E7JXU4_9ACTN|nr:hypothetical protein [Streptomyces oceani]OEU96500.1 hypothetical protein AN216_19580 [Streptomyces oceani]
MADVDFDASGVRIERWLRQLTRAGRVLVRDGRLELLTSYGREIDSAPLDDIRISEWHGVRRRALATVGGTRYLLRLGLDSQERLLDTVRTAQAKAAAERGVLDT